MTAEKWFPGFLKKYKWLMVLGLVMTTVISVLAIVNPHISGLIVQDSFIFSGTIMDNIRYGNMEASDEDVIHAAKTVCAHDFIMEMENGYMTEVNERGTHDELLALKGKYYELYMSQFDFLK